VPVQASLAPIAVSDRVATVVVPPGVEEDGRAYWYRKACAPLREAGGQRSPDLRRDERVEHQPQVLKPVRDPDNGESRSRPCSRQP